MKPFISHTVDSVQFRISDSFTGMMKLLDSNIYISQN